MKSKETILITGAGPNGITGRRIKEYLQHYHKVLSPSSKELNLIDNESVDKYFNNNKIDYVVHSAVVAPSRGHDKNSESTEVEDNLRMYFNLAAHSKGLKKMFFLGSGAEFDKSRPIHDFKEERILDRIPNDKYGFIKFILSNYSKNSCNIYNLRLFGVINPYEPAIRNVVSLICKQTACGEDIKLRRNCFFSFIDVDDISRFIKYGIENELDYHDYNLVGWSGEISKIVDIINCGETNVSLNFEMEGYNLEYSGNNERLLATGFKPTPVEVSVRKVLDFFNDSKNITKN